MGSWYKDVWLEIWDSIVLVFEVVWNDGWVIMKYDDGFFIFCYGFFEEIFFNWVIILLVGSDGIVVVLYNFVFENMWCKVSECRMLML